MDTEVAKEVTKRIQEASASCESSLRTVMTQEGLGHVQVYGRLVGDFLGHSYTNLLAPIWRAFPELEPAEMRVPYTEPKPTLTAESQEALARFVRDARVALDFVRAAVPPAEATAFFNFGGLEEVEKAVLAIEDFLANPRIREPEGKS
jgi:hypothetical protein